jgi:hypothetical protein
MVVKVGFTLHGMNRCAGGKLTWEMHRSEAACNKMLLYSAFKGGLSNDGCLARHTSMCQGSNVGLHCRPSLVRPSVA